MSNPSVEVIDSVLQNVPYKDVTGTFSWNETVRTIIEFTPPHGFNLKSKEIEPVFLQPFLLGCKGKQDNFPLPKTVRISYKNFIHLVSIIYFVSYVCITN